MLNASTLLTYSYWKNNKEPSASWSTVKHQKSITKIRLRTPWWKVSSYINSVCTAKGNFLNLRMIFLTWMLIHTYSSCLPSRKMTNSGFSCLMKNSFLHPICRNANVNGILPLFFPFIVFMPLGGKATKITTFLSKLSSRFSTWTLFSVKVIYTSFHHLLESIHFSECVKAFLE